MSERPYILAETHWKTVKNTPYEVVVLPWGATEAHNYHLPYATDNLQCDYIAAESARIAWEKGAKVVVLPTIPFGVNTGQFEIKLDINMNPGTQAMVFRDIAESLSRQGLQKIVILNGHGGNNFRQMLREIQPQYPQLFMSVINWYQVLENSRFFDEPGDHAGEMETANIQHIAPDLVLPLSEAGTGESIPFKLKGIAEGWVWAQREWHKATVDTGVGNPAKATPEKGRIFLEALTTKIAGYLVDLANSDINDLYE